MTPPHLRDANCCHTCRYGYGSGINPGWYCQKHGRQPVPRYSICDDWELQDEFE